MQHELEVNAWVWPDGDAYVVQIIAVETITGLSVAGRPRTTVTVLDDESGSRAGTLYENIASTVARASARTTAEPAGTAITDIRIDSDQFVVHASTHRSAVEVALGLFDRQHESAFRSRSGELLAV